MRVPTSNDERLLFIVAGFILYFRVLGRRSIAQRPKGAESKISANDPCSLITNKQCEYPTRQPTMNKDRSSLPAFSCTAPLPSSRNVRQSADPSNLRQSRNHSRIGNNRVIALNSGVKPPLVSLCLMHHNLKPTNYRKIQIPRFIIQICKRQVGIMDTGNIAYPVQVINRSVFVCL